MANSNILVVDDDPTQIANIKGILSDAGFIVTCAVSGTEAVSKAKASNPGVIFMDVIMPEMDGFAACRELAADPATKDVPVVFVTTKNQKADKAWAQMQGGSGYVVKPYTPDQIIEQIKALA